MFTCFISAESWLMINNLNIHNNIFFQGALPLKQKGLLNLSSNPLKPLSADTVSFSGIKPREYELKREAGSYRYYQEFPIGDDNSYRVIYHEDISSDCKKDGQAPFPPSHIEFRKPVDMSLGLDICKQNLLGYSMWGLHNENQFDILKKMLPNCSELKNEKLVSCIDAMNNTIVLELEGNRVLKMVKYNPFPEGRTYEPSFDLPLFSSVYESEGYYAFIQEKAETSDVSSADLRSVIERIKLAGYQPYDIENNETQVGWSEICQDYMLLDTECAKIKE